jgi:hypothetical protein
VVRAARGARLHGAELPVVLANDARTRRRSEVLLDEGRARRDRGGVRHRQGRQPAGTPMPRCAAPRSSTWAARREGRRARRRRARGTDALRLRRTSPNSRRPRTSGLAASRCCAPPANARRARRALAIEPLNRFECYFLNTAAACAALVRAIDHPERVSARSTRTTRISKNDLARRDPASAAARSGTCSCRRTTAAPPAPARVTSRGCCRHSGIDYRGWLVVEAFSRQDARTLRQRAARIWRIGLDAGPRR